MKTKEIMKEQLKEKITAFFQDEEEVNKNYSFAAKVLGEILESNDKEFISFLLDTIDSYHLKCMGIFKKIVKTKDPYLNAKVVERYMAEEGLYHFDLQPHLDVILESQNPECNLRMALIRNDYHHKIHQLDHEEVVLKRNSIKYIIPLLYSHNLRQPDNPNKEVAVRKIMKSKSAHANYELAKSELDRSKFEEIQNIVINSGNIEYIYKFAFLEKANVYKLLNVLHKLDKKDKYLSKYVEEVLMKQNPAREALLDSYYLSKKLNNKD